MSAWDTVHVGLLPYFYQHTCMVHQVYIPCGDWYMLYDLIIPFVHLLSLPALHILIISGLFCTCFKHIMFTFLSVSWDRFITHLHFFLHPLSLPLSSHSLHLWICFPFRKKIYYPSSYSLASTLYF